MNTVIKKYFKVFSIFASFVLFQFLLLGMFSQVLASINNDEEDDTQDEFCIDVSSVYNEANNFSVQVTGISESIDTLKRNEFSSSVVLLSSLLLGSDSFCSYGSTDSTGEISSSTRVGIVGSVEDGITSMIYDPPYIDVGSHIARNFIPGFDRSNTGTYAQSTGYDFLKSEMGLEPIWVMFRNIAYIGFVIVLVIIGFSIMFRSKIGGQGTVGISNTLPRVVLGLILVTFSFAIVGFILDLGKVGMAVVGTAINSQL